jgi:hypothetical protein
MVRAVIATLGGLVLLAGLSLPQATASTSDVRRHHYDARGLDTCNAPTHSQMAAFWHQTRWWWWGVYIGGRNRACPNSNLTARWVRRETHRGWGLQPIWVGQQAPCVGQSGLARMSHHRTRAYHQGRRAAKSAFARTRDLNMNPHTPIVFDMEAFDTGNRKCVRAVRAFVRGWSHQLGDRTAAIPGYYGSSCASDVTGMFQVSPRPAYVWGANYGSGRRVSRMSCVSRDIWPHRLKQYAGGSRVSENGVTLNVDRDCADGPMYAPRRHNLGVCS